MELLLQVWDATTVEDVCGGDDVANSLHPVEQHAHHLDQQHQKEEDDEDEVDGVEGGVGDCRRRRCAIERKVDDRFRWNLTEHPVYGEGR